MQAKRERLRVRSQDIAEVGDLQRTGPQYPVPATRQTRYTTSNNHQTTARVLRLDLLKAIILA
jgi:hypothetical protein